MEVTGQQHQPLISLLQGKATYLITHWLEGWVRPAGSVFAQLLVKMYVLQILSSLRRHVCSVHVTEGSGTVINTRFPE
jgi:hypothetical protein